MYARGYQNTHATVKHIRDSPKDNVSYGLLHDRLIGLFLFAEVTVTSSCYLGTPENFSYSQLQELHPAVFFQEDSAPPAGLIS